MTIPDIIAALCAPGPVPETAFTEATLRHEEIVPHLIELIDDARRDIENVSFDEMGYIYAMYLLAQFREPAGLRPIVDFFSVPGELPVELTGDIVTGDLARILASVCGDDDEPIRRMVADARIDELTRAAAVEAFVCLLVAGERTRDEVVAYFKTLFHGAIEREPSFLWSALVHLCVEIHPDGLRDEIDAAFGDRLVDETVVTPTAVEGEAAHDMADTLEALEWERYYMVDDAIEEMRKWRGYDRGDASAPADLSPEERASWLQARSEVLDQLLGHAAPAAPADASRTLAGSIVRESPKVGRNEPCPCGSGRKFKKCCGR